MGAVGLHRFPDGEDCPLLLILTRRGVKFSLILTRRGAKNAVISKHSVEIFDQNNTCNEDFVEMKEFEKSFNVIF